MKTNAMRMLDRAGIGYEVLEYEIAKEDFSAGAVSDLLGLQHEQCYKTLALLHEHDLYICVISADDEIDLKKASKALGVKNLEMVHVKDIMAVTGYIRGGVTSIGMKKKYPTVIDETAQLFDTIIVSGGMLGTQIHLAPDDLLKAVSGQFADITLAH